MQVYAAERGSPPVLGEFIANSHAANFLSEMAALSSAPVRSRCRLRAGRMPLLMLSCAWRAPRKLPQRAQRRNARGAAWRMWRMFPMRAGEPGAGTAGTAARRESDARPRAAQVTDRPNGQDVDDQSSAFRYGGVCRGSRPRHRAAASRSGITDQMEWQVGQFHVSEHQEKKARHRGGLSHLARSPTEQCAFLLGDDYV